MELTDSLYQAFLEVGQDLFAQGLISATAGNFSVREGAGLWITKSGVRKNRLSRDDLLFVGLEPDPGRDRGASVELVIHRAIYRATDAGAIVHAHPRTAVALSLSLNAIHPRDLEGRLLLGEVPVLDPTTKSASEEAARAVAEGLKEHPLVMLRGHGAFARGRDLFAAYARLTVLEESAQILLSAKLWEAR